MGKPLPKITLSPSRDIPLDRLELSPSNVRKLASSSPIGELADDIARRGLLQSLNVRPIVDGEGKETGRFEIPAGGRRFRALSLLVKQKRLAKDAPIPCIIRAADCGILAEDDSFAENARREALHPLDQFRAMQAMVEKGDDVETIAAHHFVTPAVVRQRLKLAGVSPKLLDVYAEDGMSLEQLMAFTISDDFERQEAVLELLKTSHGSAPGFIRQKLTENSVRVVDKRVRFVGLEAYVEAGGSVVRDLFEADGGGWLTDPVLLDKLVAAKLEADARRIGEEGWKWVDAGLDAPWNASRGMRAIYGEEVAMREAEAKSLADLEAEGETLSNEWCDADEVPDEVHARLEEIDAAVGAIVERPQIYDPAEIAIAGVFLSVEPNGSLRIERGFVKPEDEPAEPEQEVGGGEGEGDPATTEGSAIGEETPGAAAEVAEASEDVPGHVYANVRQPPVSTLNLAHLIPLSAVWAGAERDEHFGDAPLLYGKTEGSTPFRLSLHVGDVGHTLVVGPTGAGKSVLLATMAMQFRRYPRAQVFAFDFGGSIRAAALAMGGDWQDLGGALHDGEGGVALQPLARIDEAAERSWAAEWLAAMLAGEGVEIDPAAKEHLWSALTSLATAPASERTLTGLAVLLQSIELKQGLAPYCIGGPWGRLLDADDERLGDAAVQVFETEGLVGAASAGAVLSYLFHRIAGRLDGSASSPRVVQAGTVIPAALITGIRSDMPGQITAQVTQHVYDSPTGRMLLIPQGARLIGEYDSEVAAGQRRILLAWDRLILPGGRSIRLDRQPGADAAGYAGLEDRVNNHWGRMLRAALVSSLLGVGTELAAGGEGDLVRALRSGLQDSTNEAGRRVVERELSIAPTIAIRPGFAFRVIVTRDLILDGQTDGDPR